MPLPQISLVTVFSLLTAITIFIAYITRTNKHERFQNMYSDEQIAKAKALLSKQNMTFTEFKFNMPEMDVVDFNTLRSV